MDGFTGFKTAPTEELPDAVAVMDPFHVVRLAGDALDRCRRRVQQTLHGYRGRKDDPLNRARRTLHTGADLLTDKQCQRLKTPFESDDHAQVEATWGIYQRMIAAYRTRPHPRPRPDDQADRLGQPRSPDRAQRDHDARTDPQKRRTDDVLAYFDRPGTSNGPTERSTTDSNTSAAQPSASATSPTTSADHCSRPAAPDPEL